MRPTTKRAARIAGLGVAGLAVVGALLWLWLGEPRGPLIKGKPVAYWTGQLSIGGRDRDAISVLASEKDVAIPALVQQLSLPDSTVKDFANRLWLRLPAALRNRVPEPKTRAELRGGAANALIVICRRGSLATTGPSLSEAQMILPALTKALQDRDARVRSLVAVPLGYLGVISGQAIDACDVALKDPQWWVRANAVDALGRLAKSDEQAIPRIKSALSDSDPRVRERAEQLTGTPWNSSAQRRRTKRDRIEATVRPISKRAARIACVGGGVLAVVGALLWFLLSVSPGPLIQGKPVTYWPRQLRTGPGAARIDRDVISALATEKRAVIPALVKQLSLPDSRAREVVKGLWRRLPPTLRVRVSEPTTHGDLRAAAAYALVEICEQGTGPSLSEAQMILPALTKALQDRDARVRHFATTALGNLDVVSRQAIESCDVALKDPFWTVRAKLVYSLARLAKSDARAIPRLKSALSDSRPEVRKRAAAALERLGIAPPWDDASSATEAK